jgi:ABC-type cobalamin/Fe3+-siderophores transport system ATPase subunit
MRIQYIALYRFLPFTFNDIELLELNLTSDVQNVIGSNGAGKTSLLRELNPRPASRGDFGEGGYKHIQLIHNGIEYRLESNFANSSKAHSFVKESEELNSSGTSAIQEELVRRELGYTPQVHSLCYGDQRLSSIRVGLRETYLLTIHPCQMKLLLDLHKNVERRLRGFRDNMSLLLERQTALSTQMIEPLLCNQLQEESHKLTHELASVIGAIHKLSNQKQTVLKLLSEQSGNLYIRTKGERLRAQLRYQFYEAIPRDQSHDTYNTLIVSEISSCKTRLVGITQQIQVITLDIDKYEQYIRHSDAQGAIDVIESTLKTLKLDIASLQYDVVEQPFDMFYLDNIPECVSQLADLLAPFIDYNAVIPAMRDVQRMQMKYEYNTRQLASCEREESVVVNRQSQIELQLRERILETIPNTCHSCVLFQQYSTSVKKLQTDYDKVDSELSQIRLRKTRLLRLVEGRQIRLTRYNQIVPQLQYLEQYLNEHRYLFIPLKDLDLLTALRQNPSILLIRIQSHYERSKNHYLRLKKQEELDRRTADYERLKTPSEFGRQFLETMVVEKHIELEELRKTYQSNCDILSQNEIAIALFAEYTQELQRLQQEQRAYDQQEVTAVLNFDRDLCDQYLNVLESCKVKIVTRLAEIDRVIREQDGLLAARQEITNNITTISTQQREHMEMERALSPSDGIPYRYMVQFINSIIDIANPFIREVFSYPFEFIPLIEGAALTYKFPMLVGDVLVPDISECSDAQRDMADLAVRLAQIIQLKQTGYGLYLDEVDRGMDYYHRQQLLNLLKSLTENDVASQLFMVNHNVITYSGILNAEILVLNENNIVLPQVYNEHVRITHYK